jgi:hypothetical protein
MSGRPFFCIKRKLRNRWLTLFLIGDKALLAGSALGQVQQSATSRSRRIGVKNASYQFQPTIRYMGIFHGVRPAKYALSCKDCHGENSRMDWKQLGYGSDPAAVKANK